MLRGRLQWGGDAHSHGPKTVHIPKVYCIQAKSTGGQYRKITHRDGIWLIMRVSGFLLLSEQANPFRETPGSTASHSSAQSSGEIWSWEQCGSVLQTRSLLTAHPLSHHGPLRATSPARALCLFPDPLLVNVTDHKHPTQSWPHEVQPLPVINEVTIGKTLTKKGVGKALPEP